MTNEEITEALKEYESKRYKKVEVNQDENSSDGIGFKEVIESFSFGSGEQYISGSLTEFWKEQGVIPISVTPCSDGEGFSWSEFINGLGRRTQERDDSVRE